jgi:nucleoside-diphosphate-sugar epimerase
MRVLIIGGGGFIGHRLAKELVRQGGLAQAMVDHMTLVDVGFPSERIRDPRVECVEGDFSEVQLIEKILLPQPDLIFHLAAIVSGEAEKNFELGMKVNFHASLQLLEYCRRNSYRPRIVFSSSCGVFGGDVTKVIVDETGPKPRSSYGTQKAMVELLINDYSRRGFVDGRTLRLPTIAIRPGKPNAATSSFISSIIREPLNGQWASYPVAPECRFWIQSPKCVVQNLIHAANIDAKDLGDDRMITLPGLTVSVQEMIDDLERIAGKQVSSLIAQAPDAFLQSIVLTWPPDFRPERAERLGFVRDSSVDEIIRSYISEERIKI